MIAGYEECEISHLKGKFWSLIVRFDNDIHILDQNVRKLCNPDLLSTLRAFFEVFAGLLLLLK